jgi:hypothetical protein
VALVKNPFSSETGIFCAYPLAIFAGLGTMGGIRAGSGNFSSAGNRVSQLGFGKEKQGGFAWHGC